MATSTEYYQTTISGEEERYTADVLAPYDEELKELTLATQRVLGEQAFIALTVEDATLRVNGQPETD